MENGEGRKYSRNLFEKVESMQFYLFFYSD